MFDKKVINEGIGSHGQGLNVCFPLCAAQHAEGLHRARPIKQPYVRVV